VGDLAVSSTARGSKLGELERRRGGQVTTALIGTLVIVLVLTLLLVGRR
jgi:hypothetical protein